MASQKQIKIVIFKILEPQGNDDNWRIQGAKQKLKDTPFMSSTLERKKKMIRNSFEL